MCKNTSRYGSTAWSGSVLIAGLLLTLLAPVAVAGLSPEEADGYLQWLHSLERTITARQQADVPEANLLYPYDRPGWIEEPIRPYRHLAIARALRELESGLRDAGRSGLTSTLEALASARNYVNVSEFDSALVWYARAARLDTVGNFRREIARERLATAAASGDSTLAAHLVTNTLGTPELVGREDETILAFRWLLTQRDVATVDLLLSKVESQPAVLSDRVRFWQAYAYSWRDRPAEALGHLRELVKAGGLSRDLSERQRAWVLSATADLLYMTGEAGVAADLYSLLAGCTIPGLRAWGEFQLAGIAYARGDFAAAAAGFGSVCEDDHAGNWQEHACAMVPLVEELARIRKEGEDDGFAAFFAR